MQYLSLIFIPALCTERNSFRFKLYENAKAQILLRFSSFEKNFLIFMIVNNCETGKFYHKRQVYLHLRINSFLVVFRLLPSSLNNDCNNVFNEIKWELCLERTYLKVRSKYISRSVINFAIEFSYFPLELLLAFKTSDSNNVYEEHFKSQIYMHNPSVFYL